MWSNRPELEAAISVIRATPDLNLAVRAMEDRAEELLANTQELDARKLAPTLAGVAANPRARALFDLAIDRSIAADSAFLKRRVARGCTYVGEVVIGSGIHSAIYASTRMETTGDPSLVIERRERPGGVFSVARRPVFSLNSRNRPENLNERRRPGTPGPLNSEVGGVLQPSDISAQEYQTQADLAFVTRVNLALSARIMVGTEIVAIRRNGLYEIVLSDDSTILTSRIIVGSGIGEPIIGFNVRGDCPGLMTFDQFVTEVGDPTNLFPLRSYRKVAVVGANDSGKVAVEYLLGQAGDQALSVPSLDFVESINWIGQDQVFKEDFEQANRSRYKGIGRYMPRKDDPSYYYRVIPRPGRAIYASAEDDGTRLRWRQGNGERSEVFDHIIICTGFEDQTDSLFEGLSTNQEAFVAAGRVVARRLRGEAVYKIGPAAKLAVGDIERRDVPILDRLPDNSVAVFRYAELTAAFARSRSSRFGELRVRAQKPANTEPLLAERALVLPRTNGLATPDKFTVPVRTSFTLPAEAVSEDVLRCIQREVFRRSYASFTLRIGIEETKGVAGYRCAASRGDSRLGTTTRSEVQTFVSDPAVRAVLGRYFRQYKSVTIMMRFDKTPRGLWIEGSG